MTTFLFWNLNKQAVQENIVRIVQTYHIDVVMLAEYDENKMPPGDLLRLLNQDKYLKGKTCKKIWLFSHFNDTHLKLISEEKHFIACHLTLPGLPSILIIISHLPSKMYRQSSVQLVYASKFAQKIRQIEQQVNHERTIIVGDLNMNPFEDGMTYVEGLNTTLSLAQAKKGWRESGLESYPYFYNPMWNLFGDFTHGPPGTYYNNTPFNSWHMFDQVLLRPTLLDKFHISHLRILDTDGKVSLLSKQGLPNREISDHLPILFTLEL